MYLKMPFEARYLRQGDILAAVTFPIIDNELVVLGQIDHAAGAHPTHPRINTLPREHRNQQDCFTGQTKMRLAPAAVISHCCELELRSGKCLLPSIAVARVMPVKRAILNDADKMASLKGNRDPRDPSSPGYRDYFYLEPDQKLGPGEWVVDFSQIASVAATEYQRLVQQKILQLTDRERVKFKIKLAAYLCRLTDEEQDQRLENPWADDSFPQQKD